MIQIRKITPPTVDIFYGPGDVFIGTFNEYELIDFRIQIKENQVSGYYLIVGDETVQIDQNGNPDHWPEGLLDLMPDLMSKLFNVGK